MNAILLTTLFILATANSLLGISIRVSDAGNDPDDISAIHILRRTKRNAPDRIAMNSGANRFAQPPPRMSGRKRRDVHQTEERDAIPRRHRRAVGDESIQLPENYPHHLPMWPEKEEKHSSPTRLWSSKNLAPKKKSPFHALGQSMVWPDGDFMYKQPRMWGRRKRSVRLYTD